MSEQKIYKWTECCEAKKNFRHQEGCQRSRLTEEQAAALVQLLHICMGERQEPFYATAKVFGFKFYYSDSRLGGVAWPADQPTDRSEFRKEAARFFRVIAEAFEEENRNTATEEYPK